MRHALSKGAAPLAAGKLLTLLGDGSGGLLPFGPTPTGYAACAQELRDVAHDEAVQEPDGYFNLTRTLFAIRINSR